MKLSIPETWQTTKLTELAIYVIGGDWGKEADFESTDYSTALCIRGAEFRNWNEDKGSTAAPRKIKKSSLANRVLKDGDILVEISGGGPEQPVGRTVLIDKEALSYSPEVPKICTNFVRLLRTADEIDSRFLNAYLTFFYASGEIRDYQAGSNNLRNLKFNDYLGIDIPIPPFNEQHRIVAKIEELFSELDKGIENLKTAQAQLKVYRQALLKHAFEGKLTAQWRAENQDKLETADALLKRIQQERAQRYQQQLADWQTNGGSKPKAPKSLPPLTAEELAELPELPGGWGWVKSEEICASVRDGTHDTPKYAARGIPLVTSKNLRGGKIDFSDAQFISEEDHKSISVRSAVDRDDVLYAMIGTIGNPVVVSGTEVFSIKNVALFKGNPQFLDSEFLSYWLGSAVCDRVLTLLELLKGTTQKFIPLGNLRILPVPICSLLEQQQIVQILSCRLSEVDQLDQTLTTSLQQAEALRQSILKKAFSGQLVPQDSHDEPASALLARIKAELGQSDTPKHGRKSA